MFCRLPGIARWEFKKFVAKCEPSQLTGLFKNAVVFKSYLTYRSHPNTVQSCKATPRMNYLIVQQFFWWSLWLKITAGSAVSLPFGMIIQKSLINLPTPQKDQAETTGIKQVVLYLTNLEPSKPNHHRPTTSYSCATGIYTSDYTDLKVVTTTNHCIWASQNGEFPKETKTKLFLEKGKKTLIIYTTTRTTTTTTSRFCGCYGKSTSPALLGFGLNGGKEFDICIDVTPGGSSL